MPLATLDRIDRKILDVLQREGRIATTDGPAGRPVHVAPLRAREAPGETGVITGYHARVAPESIGKTLLVFVEIRPASKSGDVFDAVKKEVLHMPEVMECDLVSGGFETTYQGTTARHGRVPEYPSTRVPEYRHLLGKILKKLPVPAEFAQLRGHGGVQGIASAADG
jgi:Lrp/AsnC family leucine-responsive transcriptional regulator